MKRTAMIFMVLGLVVLATAPAQAQRRGGGRGFGSMRNNPLFMLRTPELQKELKLSDDQRADIGGLMSEALGAMQDLRDADEEERREIMQELMEEGRIELNKILDKDQQKRLHEIQLQQQGPAGVVSAEVAKELKISEEQKGKIETIIEETGEAQRELFGELREGGDREEVMQKVQALRKERDETVLALLSADQKKQWTTMLGEPFEMPRRGFGGGGRRGGGGGRRGEGGGGGRN